MESLSSALEKLQAYRMVVQFLRDPSCDLSESQKSFAALQSCLLASNLALMSDYPKHMYLDVSVMLTNIHSHLVTG